MTWIVLIALAIALLAALLFALRGRREGWEAIAAALMVGLAGYALQGHPNVPSAPKAAASDSPANAADMVQDRHRFAGMVISPNKWVLISDALATQGQYQDAANMLRGATGAEPKNSDAWLAQANALVSHAQGTLPPAALYAFRKAAAADPTAPGPAMFLGLAMARAGRFEETKTIWQELLARAPANAPWRPDLVERLKRLDRVMAMIRQQEVEEQRAETAPPPAAGFPAPSPAPPPTPPVVPAA